MRTRDYIENDFKLFAAVLEQLRLSFCTGAGIFKGNAFGSVAALQDPCAFCIYVQVKMLGLCFLVFKESAFCESSRCVLDPQQSLVCPARSLFCVFEAIFASVTSFPYISIRLNTLSHPHAISKVQIIA